MRRLFSFPNPVNETSARLVAAGVIVQAVLFLSIRSGWLLIPLAYGFLARVLTGPTLSPLGQLATRVGTPLIHADHRLVPGPPKRFAQGVGLVFSGGAAIAWLSGGDVVTYALIACLIVAAALESICAVCLGCRVFAVLMRHGFIPAEVCEECNNVSTRLLTSTSSSR